LAVKKFGEKGYCKALAKKTLANFELTSPIINHRNEAIPNIDEHNKTNSVFSRIWSVLFASSVFDDGR